MTTTIIGIRVSIINYDLAVRHIWHWTQFKNSRYVCAANVHTLMEAHDSPEFMDVINQADLVTPDGVPLVWMLRLKGYPDQQRVYGPTLMLHVLEAAAHENLSVGFYGSSPKVLQSLLARLQARFPNLKVDYSFSPPFQDMSQEEDAEIVKRINASSVPILFVGLGCPKQEKWMAEHRGKIPCVMIGVGAAFDFHAGLKPQAPGWMQQIGMEWLFRLLSEPGRLWWRYFFHNPRFIFLAILDLLGFLG